jgi:hypothetical protein
MLHRRLKRGEPLFLRWTIVTIARELEGRLIEMFDPSCNFDPPEPRLRDEERIPSETLPGRGRFWPRGTPRPR